MQIDPCDRCSPCTPMAILPLSQCSPCSPAQSPRAPGTADVAANNGEAAGDAGNDSVLTPESLPAAAIRKVLTETLHGKDLSCISVGEIRSQVALKFGFLADGLETRKREIKKLTADVVQDLQAERGEPTTVVPFLKQLLAQTEEDVDARQSIYLVTISRVLDAELADGRQYKDLEGMSRQDIADAVRDALLNPALTALGGRKRSDGTSASLVTLLVVFMELHADGSVHFHIVVRLTKTFRFNAAKKTLCERHCLPSHWSCSHTHLWSALRYSMVAMIGFALVKEGSLATYDRLIRETKKI